MQNITVEKARLLEALKNNKKTHVDDFNLAWEGFMKQAQMNVEELLKALKKAPRGQAPQLYIGLEAPRNHEHDYQRAIEMCDWETGDQIDLTEEEFQQFVQDDWNWKHQFNTSNQLYTGSVSPSSRPVRARKPKKL